MNLASADYELLLKAIATLNSDSKIETLPARTLSSVFSVIPNELIVFDCYGADGVFGGNLWYSPPYPESKGKFNTPGKILNRLSDYAETEIRENRGAKRVLLKKFRSATRYNDFYKSDCLTARLAACLKISRDFFVSCSLHRLKRDFTSRDRRLLNLLSPHLSAAFRNAQFIRRILNESKNLYYALEISRYGFLSVDMNFIVCSQNPNAARLLRKYFPPPHLSPSGALPEELTYFIGLHRETILSEEFYLPASLLEIVKENSKLKVSLTFEVESQKFILLLEEFNKPKPADLQILGLTGREAEILFFLTRGKTNREIGALCGISSRTAQKHLENIFTKLGVETRTAAVGRALEVLR